MSSVHLDRMGDSELQEVDGEVEEAMEVRAGDTNISGKRNNGIFNDYRR